MSGGNSEPLYNTDTLNKACISTRILTSPQRYSVMRSRVPRLRHSAGPPGSRSIEIPGNEPKQYMHLKSAEIAKPVVCFQA